MWLYNLRQQSYRKSTIEVILFDFLKSLFRIRKYLRACFGSTFPPKANKHFSQRTSRTTNSYLYIARLRYIKAHFSAKLPAINMTLKQKQERLVKNVNKNSKKWKTESFNFSKKLDLSISYTRWIFQFLGSILFCSTLSLILISIVFFLPFLIDFGSFSSPRKRFFGFLPQLFYWVWEIFH